MIGAAGRHRAAIGIAVGLAVAVGFGLRAADSAAADPAAAAAREARLLEAADGADVTLLRLTRGLEAARDHARRGTALTVEGEAPAPEIIMAAELLAAAGEDATAARGALRSLAGMAAAIRPGADVPTLSYGGPDLQQMAAQLRSGAEAATTFVERRHATEAVVDALAAALAALDGDDPTAALAALDEADAPLALLEAWEERSPLFRYWMTTSRDLIAAAGDIARATIANDPTAVEAAAKRYAAAAETARGADNALAFTLSEEGSAISGTPLRRLAAAADEAADDRSALQALLQPTS
ncbi:MAG: hypothetical protein ABI864_00335 [Chloroflexota bacterium]